MKRPEHYYARTEINQRDNNEDNLDKSKFYVIGELPITVLSVADGMGGHEHGEDVSRAGLLEFSLALFGELKAIDRSPPLTSEKFTQAMLNALAQANSQVRQMVAANKWHKAGSTIVSAAVWGDRLVAVNLGDSPLFHYEAETGQLVQVTLDHSVPAILAKAGLITAAMARDHQRRGQLEFFLGCDATPDPMPIYERVLKAGDLLLLCSDGVSGTLGLEQIQQILARTDTSLAEQADLLIQAALAAGETDNQTLILWSHVGHHRSQNPSSLTATASISHDRSISAAHQEQEPVEDLHLLHSSRSEHQINNVPQGLTNRVSNSRKHHPIRQLVTPRNGSWLLFGIILATGAVVWGISDPGLVRTVDTFKSIPTQLDKLRPKASPPKSPRILPKGLPQASTKNIYSNINSQIQILEN
jgi:PPM family protein phosphatase